MGRIFNCRSILIRQITLCWINFETRNIFYEQAFSMYFFTLNRSALACIVTLRQHVRHCRKEFFSNVIPVEG